jgi:3'-phosphoadenosine 5'-phosphosulfate sulfotransferase (PAPS reductase)/FAD synthetase
MTVQALIPQGDKLAQVEVFDAPDSQAQVIASDRPLTLDEKVRAAIEAIKAQVVVHGRVLVVAWSGGKDSSTLLNLTFQALRELKAEGQQIPALYVVHSRTLMDNPVLDAFNRDQIRQMKAFAKRVGVRTQVLVASPNLSNDYLVGILAGRTIASVGNSSKCQQMAKAYPLGQLKKQIRKHVAQQQGVSLKEARLVSLIGTRRDESASRAARMEKRGESAIEAVEAMAGSGELVLSAIADFETMEIFEYLSQVRNGRVECYAEDKFKGLVDLYRAMTGECMVTSYLAGTDQAKNGCSGGRSGCWTCLRVSKDASVEAMLAEEDGRYEWLRPLNDFRNYLQKRHFDPRARLWLARTVSDDGSITIQPNAYSPEFTKELLGILLTVQHDEQLAADRLGIAPRFQVITERQLVGLDFFWSRYGYQHGLCALQMYKDVSEGKRWEIPDLSTIPEFTQKDVAFRARMPFADHEYWSPYSGFQSVEHAAAGAENLTTTPSGMLVSDVNIEQEFGIDEEGLELFMQFELDYALSRFDYQNSNPYPSAAVHYLLSVGLVHLSKGAHSELDRILRVNNQMWRHGLLPILNDPHAIIAKLKAAFPDHPLCVVSAAQSSTSFGEAEEVIEQIDAVPVSLKMVQQAFDF